VNFQSLLGTKLPFTLLIIATNNNTEIIIALRTINLVNINTEKILVLDIISLINMGNNEFPYS